ncbi:sodium-coupled monocarboxylate transporter 1 [Plakobranchus ocellatus]|uniref:Sodium-coupled monocarboxylate transporter 1 n=1 Tax=Plakobranchus ocellatus TaxID=259542 RepID=A0AAV4DCI8_9GAST|nr:sodium-coupled monocarboxylate transporter 1 [Plakobranchus ocellatus]
MASPVGPVYFGIADYVLLGIMLIGSMVIGLYFAVSGTRQKSKLEYLLGGRRLTAFPVCLSLFATFQSAIALLGIPAEVYSYGTMFVYSYIGTIISYVLALFTSIPLIYPLRLTSVYEYLALRYQSRTVQQFGAFVGVICSLTYMTIALLSPALALETAAGIPLWLSIILVGIVGTVYTTLGGIKSVIWTDVFQTGIIYAGVLTVLVKGTMDAGGAQEVWKVNEENGRINFGDTRTDLRVRHTIWNQSIGSIFFWLAINFTQSSIQRVSSTKTIKEAYKVYMFTIPIAVVFGIVLIITGLVQLAYFHAIRCDPLAAGYVDNKNQLMPYFVLHTLRFLPGLSGLYISTIFSGALSTLSSGINSIAANIVEDFLYKFLQHRSESAVTTFTKIIVCFLGTIIIVLAYFAKGFQGPVTQLSYTALSASNGPLVGLFLLGALFPQANSTGALVGFTTALVACFWQAIGSQKLGHRTETLPLGPTDRCPTNKTSISLTTAVYAFTANQTEEQESFEIKYLTTPLYKGSNHTKDFLSHEERAFSFYDISYVWSPLIGVLITVLVGLLTSLIVSQFLSKKLRPQAKFIFPFCRRLWYSDLDVLNTEVKLKDME